MDTRDLEYLVASAKAGNFSRAARSLGLTPSTISRRIGRLEDELGLALFERGHFGVRPTIGGRVVLNDAQRALAGLGAVKRSGAVSALGAAGRIRLGVAFAPTGPLLTSLLAGWREHYPDVALSLQEMDDQDLSAALEDHRVDSALTFQHSVAPHAASSLLFRDRLCVALPARHPLAARESISTAALREEIILLQAGEENRATRELYVRLLGTTPKFQTHPVSKQSILALVGAGFGVTLMAASQCAVEVPQVVFRAIDDPMATIEVVLTWLSTLEDAVVGRFVAFMRDGMRARRPL